ncbi:MAG: flagellar motor protein MotA [Bacteroidetes bacterium HGW-Bacteroidetes-6]|jgi:biopolymer transport protein ExbB|nr:MAG: flagellar motor protein MotA [Bacteroidetes bacterium HGW-Bacteroidetes-6]
MKKLISLVAITGLLFFGAAQMSFAQDAKDDSTKIEKSDSTVVDSAAANSQVAPINGEEPVAAEPSFHQILKEKFIEGGAGWMTPILIVFVLGLALVIERILYLNLSRTNTKKLLEQIEESLQANDVQAAKEICRNTRGPVASVFYQGLDRFNEGIDMIEKSIVSYGGVQMGRLESNLSWIGLFIALAPMLGFLGTVVGMVAAFDNIEAQGDISPTVVAGGMKVALLTTVFGLIVAIFLQILYNVVVSLIEKLVNDMEDSTITFMDIVFRSKNVQKQ